MAAIFMIFMSCGFVEYPMYRYTNETDKVIRFKTAEKDSSLFILDVNSSPQNSFSIPSGVWGRGEIISINERLVTWEYHDKNVYDIRFIDRPDYPLTIENYSDIEIILTEKNGLIEPETVTVGFVDKSDPLNIIPGTSTSPVKLYTLNPVFYFLNVTNLKSELEKDVGTFTLTIKSP